MPDANTPTGSTGSNILGTVTSAIPIVGGLYNAISQGIQNKKARDFTKEMYDKQRADSLSDWNMQNAYNSPAAQMQRLKDAGLNPNLVYGSGADATSSQPVKQSDTSSHYSASAPQLDTGGIVQGFLAATEIGQKKAQTDILATQKTVMEQDAALKAAQAAAAVQRTAKDKFTLGMAQSLADVSMEFQRQMLKGKMIQNQVMLDSNEMNIARTSANIQEAAQRILTSRLQNTMIPAEKQKLQAQIDNLNKDAKIKQFTIDLEKSGITPTDNLGARLLGMFLNGSSVNMDNLKANMSKPFGDSFKSLPNFTHDLFGGRRDSTTRWGVNPW